MEKGMIKASAVYNNKEGLTFDMDYYLNNHVPMVQRLFGDKLKGVTLEKGIGSAMPGAPAPYFLIASMFFANVEDCQSAFAAHAGELMADIPKFTNSELVIQVSEVMV